jgi:hypothetical protein
MEFVLNTGPKLFLEPASYDGRSHPTTPISSNSTPTTTVVTSTDGITSAGGLVVYYDGGYKDLSTGIIYVTPSGSLNSGFNLVTASNSDSVSGSWTLDNIIPISVHHGRQLHSVSTPDNGPHVISRSAFDGVSTLYTGSGIVKGYGTAHSASELNQNGQVIADGLNQQRTLDLSAVGTIKNTTDNARTGHNGWFAQHKGKLVLPAVAINDGKATWGEDPADPQLDLINSVRLSVGPEVFGSIKLSLLATDRSDYPTLPSNVKPIGVWQVEPIDMVLGSVDLTVRYDVDLANDLRLNSELNLWGSYDGQWQLADATSVDSFRRLIHGHLGSVDYFAVAGSSQTPTPTHITGTPEPTTMLGLACAGLLLARRRRR